ncbi:MAG: LacI family DNA-binding transcriptional regulator [Steroidobacteraceae bacterium]
MTIKQEKLGIKEVAAETGFSIATVSRALQQPERVTSKTRKVIEDAVRRLGYKPNAQARNLRTAKTKLIIALVPDISNPFYAEVIRGIEQVAHERRYSLLLGDTQHNVAREQAYADILEARQADGLITLIPHIPKIRVDGPLPVVNACECVKDRAINSIGVDNVKGAVMAVDHLVSLGHRRIAFIAGPIDSPLTVDRKHGYDLALKKAGLKIDPDLTMSGNFSIESGLSATEQLIASKLKFSAIFCCNDEMAIGAIGALKAHGLRIPQDVSVIGFDDIRFARYCDPALTTVAQPKLQLGREATGMLLDILVNGHTTVVKKILPTDLIVRDSTGKCPASLR